MSKERYNQIIDEIYENYSDAYEKDNSLGRLLLIKRTDGKSTYRKIDKDTFITLCTHDKYFSKEWGLKIEKRELSIQERLDIYDPVQGLYYVDLDIQDLDILNIPTKQTTLTYQNEKIEVYE